MYEATDTILQNHKNEWEPLWVVQKKIKCKEVRASCDEVSAPLLQLYLHDAIHLIH